MTLQQLLISISDDDLVDAAACRARSAGTSSSASSAGKQQAACDPLPARAARHRPCYRGTTADAFFTSSYNGRIARSANLLSVLRRLSWLRRKQGGLQHSVDLKQRARRGDPQALRAVEGFVR